MVAGTLVFDIETHSADLLYTMPPVEFVRLIGYKWIGGSGVTLTTDLEEIREQILQARWIIGHNIHSFDLPAVFGVYSDIPLELAMQKRVYDTWTHAALVNPAPYQYINRFGTKALADKPDKAKKWFGLSEQAYQLGVKGKVMDLAELAMEFGDPGLKGKAKENSGYGRIPVDDERYREYLIGDVEASEAVAKALLAKGPLDDYALREQEIESRKTVISNNGVRLNIEKATRRRDELTVRRDEILRGLQESYGLPTKGDAPWDTNEGKQAILAALADHGITPKTVDWPKTPAWENRKEKIKESRKKAAKLEAQVREWRDQVQSGDLPARSIKARERWIIRDDEKADELRRNPLPPAFGLSLGGKELIALTTGTPAEELGRALAELKGQRSLSQLALDSVHPDGFVHPDITMLQRSGRWSTTRPGLTIWTNNGPGAVEKDYFDADNDDDVLIEFDYSNADARVVAALSGDPKYAKGRFEPGADGHMLNAIAAWGADVVATDPKKYRQKGKPYGHGWSYGGGPTGLAKATGGSIQEATEFCNGMNAQFHVLVAWQNSVRAFARQHGYVVNDWGRKMWVEKGREYTQAPALLGQSGTREIICDALLAMPIHVLRRVKAQIHDALLMSVPKKNWEACRDYVLNLMETSFKPKQGGQLIDFPATSGPPGRTWYEAIH